MGIEIGYDWRRHEYLENLYRDKPWALNKETPVTLVSFDKGNVTRFIEGFNEVKNGDEGPVSNNVLIPYHFIQFDKNGIPKQLNLYDVDNNYDVFQKYRDNKQDFSRYKTTAKYQLSDKNYWAQFRNEQDGRLIVEKTKNILLAAIDMLELEKTVVSAKRDIWSDISDIVNPVNLPLMIKRSKVTKEKVEFRFVG